jgi:thiol-disulfide isomerase/thioredoxin
VKRRQVVAALAGVGLTGGSLWVAGNGLPGPGGTDQLPHRVETIDAPGSTAGEALVPTPETVTVVDLFATWCPPCDDQVRVLGDVRPDYPEVSFVSVTNERVGESLSREDVADWWAANGGAWPVGLDPGGDLLAAMGATGLPHVAVTDRQGRVTFEDGGLVGADALRAALDDVV